MSEMITTQWCGVLWSVGEQDHGMYRCTVVDLLGQAAPGWHLGEHCWLTAQELHPTQGKDTP